MANSSATPKDVMFARLFKDAIAEGLRHGREVYTDTAQAAVWIVGLASAIVVATLANAEARRVLGPQLDVTVASLFICVVSGVAYRLMGVWLAPRVQVHFATALGAMQGYAAGADTVAYPELSETWDRSQIVKQLGEHFEVDYSFLLTYNAPLDECKRIYRSVRARRQAFEDDAAEQVRQVVLAFTDQSELVAPDLHKARRRTRWFKRSAYFGAALFSVCALSFAWALFLIARAVWGA
jgi:hypothetical protein